MRCSCILIWSSAIELLSKLYFTFSFRPNKYTELLKIVLMQFQPWFFVQLDIVRIDAFVGLWVWLVWLDWYIVFDVKAGLATCHLAGDHGKLQFTRLALLMSLVVTNFVLFFPQGVLG